MSDFSFNSSGPGRASAFQRLASGSVNTASKPSDKESGVSSLSQTESKDPAQSDDAVARSVFNRLSGLESSVSDLRQSKGALEVLAGDKEDLASEIATASNASVRDVDAAADLAEQLSSRILGNGDVATDAQVSGLNRERVQRALR